METDGMFRCFVSGCSKCFFEAKSLVCHIKLLHSNLNIVKFSCKFEHCFREFDRMKFFEKHLASHNKAVPHNKKRKTADVNDKTSYVDSDVLQEFEEFDDDKATNFDKGDDSIPTVQTNTPVLFFDAISKSVTKFLARMYTKDTLTRNQIQEVVEEVKDLCCGSFLDILQEVVKKMVEDPQKSNVTEIGVYFDIMRGMFNDVDSDWKRTRFFSQKNAYIEPEKYTLGTATAQKTEKGHVIVEPILLTGTFISSKKILKRFLELPGVLQKIISYMDSLDKKSDVMENFVQGSLWTDVIKPKFGDKLVLPLTLSFDDFETNKDLGSHATVHKLSACHISVSSIPPAFLSLLENMFLTLLYHSSDKAFGLDQVFRPLLSELKELEQDGIEVTVDNCVKRVYFALCLLVGDNLGLSLILGLMEGFMANYFCRICKVHREVAKSLIYEQPDLLRNKDNYENDLQLNDPSSTGVKVKCVWNELSSFLLTENIYADIMHDIIEGVGDYNMCFIIEYLVVGKKWLTYEELNELVQGFYYGNQEFGNKPPLIMGDRVKKECLGFSAIELLCLIRFFPLMVGHKVKEEDPVWHFYLCFRELIDLLFSPTFSRATIPYLTQLIAQHHDSYLKLSKRHLRPKYHNMLHYSRIIERVGPLQPIWAMRWESNYKELRQAAHVTSCRKNISLTLATKTSLKLCARIIDQRGLIHRFLVSPYCERVLVSSLDRYDDFVGNLASALPGDGYWDVAKWLKVDGTMYKPGMVVVLGLDNSFPVFGTIHFVIVTANDPSFLVKKIITVRFNPHLHSYLVNEDPSSYVFVRQRDLITHTPAHKRLFIDGQIYVMPRHAL